MQSTETFELFILRNLILIHSVCKNTFWHPLHTKTKSSYLVLVGNTPREVTLALRIAGKKKEILILKSFSNKPLFLHVCSTSLLKIQILDSSKLKEFADDNFKFDENGKKFSKPVEKTVRKGEIAHYQQFLLFPQCFLKTNTSDT